MFRSNVRSAPTEFCIRFKRDHQVIGLDIIRVMICGPRDMQTGDMPTGDTRMEPTCRLSFLHYTLVAVTLIQTQDCTHLENMRVVGP